MEVVWQPVGHRRVVKSLLHTDLVKRFSRRGAPSLRRPRFKGTRSSDDLHHMPHGGSRLW